MTNPSRKPTLIERWKAAEPVRLYLYSVLVPLVAGLVAMGVLQGKASTLIYTVGVALLGITGTESARRSVVAPLSLAMPDGTEVARQAVDSVPGRVVAHALIREYAGRHRTPEAGQ